MTTHTPCPKCRELGNDQKGDNLAVYDDGHAWCFACGYYRPPPLLSGLHARLHGKTTPTVSSAIPFDRDSCSQLLPRHSIDWLNSYGLTPKELEGVFYNYTRDCLCFTIVPGKVVNCRNFRPGSTKYTTWGNKSVHFARWGTVLPIVLVEDCVSAIKIARVASSIPLLGTDISDALLAHLLTAREPVRIWLDYDKKDKAMKMSRTLAQFLDCATIITAQDPKCYSTEDILKNINDTLPEPTQSLSEPRDLQTVLPIP